MDENTVSLTADCKVRGQTTTARDSDTKINVFKGIPYALPPSGSQRFMPPQTFPLWTGTRDAFDYGPVCPQNKTASTKSYFPFSFSPNMSDDCLYLNVWTPSLNIASKLPVMVWIYGGAYQRGSGSYHIGTAMAARQNVVYVTFNYRIGVFGFLCTGDEVVKGNMGLLDQIEALRWIQRHIVQFGGDPDNVTVFGESAGSISITHHIVSPLSRGLFKSAVKANSLFRRGICQSGTCFYPGAYFSPQQSRKFLLKRLPAMGCTSTDSKEILEFLQSVPAEEIVKHLALFSYPVKDDARCPEPFEAYQTGTFNPVDPMIGFTSHEGADFIFDLAGGQYVSSKEQAEDIVTRMVKVIFYRGHPAADSIIRALCEEYLDEAGSDTIKQTQALVEMYGDLLFVAPTIPHAVAHSSEPFLERFPDIWSDEDKRVSDNVMSLWASFARNGVPRSADIPEWPLFKQDDQKYLNIGAKSEIRANFKPHRISFWTQKISSILNEAPTPLSKY